MVDIKHQVKDDFWNKLVDLKQQGYLPDLGMKVKYKFYSLSGSKCFAHKSIALTADGKNFVTVELTVKIGVDGKKRTFPETRPVAESKKDKMTYLGEVEGSAFNLIYTKALEVMEKFGNYCKPCNNCQDFCNFYTKAVGLKAQEFTDRDKVSAGAGLFGVVLMGLYSILRLLSK